MRALVLLSGGLDSAVALWWAQRAGHDIVPLTYRYKGRPVREARAARDLADRAGLHLIEADLPFLAEPADAPLVHERSRVARDAPRGYIPARNAIFYATAAYYAELLACDIIVGGHHAEDAARFPDATPSFFERFERIVQDGLWSPDEGPPHGPSLVMPLIALTKLEVVALGRELGVPMALAWSCYEDGEAPCGACPSCTERHGVAAEALAL
ncbi:MAG: 7-cyano-7-deazaguanine synthase [Candidatus Thermoplasmatota archaeon]